MGSIKKFFRKAMGKKLSSTRPGGTDPWGSRAITGIAPGDRGTNVGNGTRGSNRRPGRRGADTPLGPGRRRM